MSVRLAVTGAALTLATVGLATLATPAAANPVVPAVPAAPAAPDPSGFGRHKTVTATYNLGDRAFRVKGFNGPIELTGVVHHPERPAGKRFPLVVFLHGRHVTCGKSGDDVTATWPCKNGYKPIQSYRGYDYVGRRLASHGYVVVSISANGINAADGSNRDDGMTARGQLIQKHLDLWKNWATKGGAPFGTRFRNAIDFTRVGTMGHSRGGEGVVRNYQINAAQGSPYGIRAVLPLAATDFQRRVPTGVAMATVLPYCDGDVSDLQGVHYYDDARYRLAGDPAPKHTVTVFGANHNYFNTAWSPGSRTPGAMDDWIGPRDSACHPSSRTRLSEEAQRNVGRAYLMGFFRHYLGGERAFGPLWRGETAPPPSAGSAKVLVSYHAPANRRRDVNRFLREAHQRTNALGGAVTARALRLNELCGGAEPVRATCTLRNSPDHYVSEPHRAARGGPAGMTILMNGWQSPQSALVNEIPAASGDVSGYRALSFRAAQDFTDPRNPKDRVQNLHVTLTDATGHRTSVPVAPYAAALAYPPQPGRDYDVIPHFLLNQVRVPLSAFTGADLHNIRSVTLEYSATPQGTLGLTDLLFTD